MTVKRDFHVYEVAILEVDLSRTTGALDDDDIVSTAQLVERFRDRAPEFRFELGKARRGDSRQRSAPDDNLRVIIAFRFQQHRVHGDRRRNARRFGLDHLGAADLVAGGGYEGVERHVLRLERRDS